MAAHVIAVNGRKFGEARSKAEATRKARSLRSQGVPAFVHSAANWAKGFGQRAGKGARAGASATRSASS